MCYFKNKSKAHKIIFFRIFDPTRPDPWTSRFATQTPVVELTVAFVCGGGGGTRDMSPEFWPDRHLSYAKTQGRAGDVRGWRDADRR